MELIGEDELTLEIIESGCVTWQDLLRSVRNFKYGRGENRGDFEQVWYQRMGTCSTKHGFLYQVAQKNQFKEVQLMVGMYLMNQENTPKIGGVLAANHLTSIPEAHCYLKVGENYVDATSNHSDYLTIAEDIIEERSVHPEFLITDKVHYHKEFLKKWIVEQGLEIPLEELWEVRESCIEVLSSY